MLDTIKVSAASSTELRTKIEDLRTLLLPFLETAKELRSMEFTISKSIEKKSQTIRHGIRDALTLMQRKFEDNTLENVTTSRLTMIDHNVVQEHLMEISNGQTRSIEAQLAMATSIKEMRAELSSLHQREILQSRSPLDIVERYRLMKKDFDDLRMRILQDAHIHTKNILAHSVASQRSPMTVLELQQGSGGIETATASEWSFSGSFFYLDSILS